LGLKNEKERRTPCAINALERKDGEYILFAEDNGAQKVNIFRWKP